VPNSKSIVYLNHFSVAISYLNSLFIKDVNGPHPHPDPIQTWPNFSQAKNRGSRLLVVGGDCTPKAIGHSHADHNSTTIWVYGSAKIALNGSIFLICIIGVEEAHWSSNLNGGGVPVR
jgi:hypothetical protein